MARLMFSAKPMMQRADQRAIGVAYAAKDRGGEDLDDEAGAHVGFDLGVEADEDAAKRRRSRCRSARPAGPPRRS